jgi:hypothetical protein
MKERMMTMHKLVIKPDNEGILHATVTTDFNVGKVIINDKNLCFLYYNGIMQLADMQIRQLINKRCTPKYTEEMKFKELMEAAENYYNAKLCYNMGLRAVNLTLTNDNKVLGLADKHEFEIIIDKDGAYEQENVKN